MLSFLGVMGGVWVPWGVCWGVPGGVGGGGDATAGWGGL